MNSIKTSSDLKMTMQFCRKSRSSTTVPFSDLCLARTWRQSQTLQWSSTNWWWVEVLIYAERPRFLDILPSSKERTTKPPCRTRPGATRSDSARCLNLTCRTLRSSRNMDQGLLVRNTKARSRGHFSSSCKTSTRLSKRLTRHSPGKKSARLIHLLRQSKVRPLYTESVDKENLQL